MSLPTSVTFTDSDPSGISADALVLAARKNDGKVVLVEGTGLSQEAGSAVESALTAVGAEAGAEEVTDQGESFEVVCDPADLVTVRTALQDAGIDYDSAEAQFVPSMHIEVDADKAGRLLKLIDTLEDSDDVQNVYANFDVPADVQAQLDDED